MKTEFNYLSNNIKVLVSLLDTRCCTSEHIYECFGYASLSTASIILNKLMEAGHLSVEQYFRGFTKYAYFLTNSGSEFALSCIGKPAYLREGGKLIPQFISSAESKYKPNYIPHAINISKFYYMLLKECGYGNFSWALENETMLTSSEDKKVVLRGDASFTYNNEKFIIEQDMGTESRQFIQRKLGAYAQALKDFDIYPTILFVVSIENDNKKVNFNSNPKIADLQLEVNALKEHLGKVSIKNDLLKQFEGKCHIELVKDIEREAALIKDFGDRLKASELKKTQERVALLGEYLKGDLSIDVKDKEKSEVYDKKKGELQQLKSAIVNAYIDTRCSSRINYIRDILLSYDDTKISESIFYLMLNGLNVYVNTFEEMKNYVIYQVTGDIDYADMISQLFRLKAINSGVSDSNIEISEYTRFPFGNFDVAASKSVIVKPNRDAQLTDSSIVIIEDISSNNIGAYSRVIWMAQYMNDAKHYSNTTIVTIVSNTQQAKEISSIISQYYSEPNSFLFIDVKNLYNKDITSDTVRELDKRFYNIIDNTEIRK